MRNGLRFLGVCGVLGLAINVSAAADNGTDFDRFLHDDAGRRAPQINSADDEQEPARTSITDAEASDGEMIEESSTLRSRRSMMDEASQFPAESKSEAMPAKTRTELPKAVPGVKNFHRELFGAQPRAKTPRMGKPTSVGTMLRPSKVEPTDDEALQSPADGKSTAARNRRNMIHAEYKRADNKARRDEIRQVEGREERTHDAPAPPEEAAPMPPLDDFDFGKHSEESNWLSGNAADRQPKQEKSTGEMPAFGLPRGEETEASQPQARMRALPSVHPKPTQSRHHDAGTMHEPMAGRAATVRDSEANGKVPNVSVHWVNHGEVNVGQECELGLVVKNSGESSASNIAIDAFFPASVRIIKAQPEPTESTDHLSWAIASLDAGAEQTIRIRLVPSARGELATSANVRFTGSAAGVFQVEEPILQIEIKGPQEVMAGDLASQTVILSNPGSGAANNVTVEARVPEGLEHPRGERLVMEIGSLASGESRLVRLPLAAVSGGTQTIQIEARADANLSQTITREITVIAPSIKIAIEGPSLRYIGRTADYKITVTNDGSGASNNVRVMHQLPEGFKLIRADKSGTFDSSQNAVGWFIGRLESRESVTVHVELTAGQPGQFVQKVTAISEHGARSEAELATKVDGTASLVMEIVDLNDPVEVGSETAYEVRVRNEGTAAAQNVGVSCELPSAVELLDAKGPADHLVESGMVVFKVLDKLEPGKTAIYRVKVTGRSGGNHRFRARLVSDSNEEPLIFEELTKFYGDER